MNFKLICVIVLIIAIEVNAEKLENYSCPMRGKQLSGYRARTIGEVRSWQTCGYFCKLTSGCKYWNWRQSIPRECELLNDNNGSEYTETSEDYGDWDLVISGDEDCY